MDRRSARIREERLAKKRNEEYQRQLLWQDVNQYYRNWDLQASKHNGWLSPRSRDDSEQSLLESRRKTLDARRKKLAELFAKEENEYEQELKQIYVRDAGHEPPRVEEGEDDETRSKEVELKKYAQWKSTQPAIREHERRQRDRFIKQNLIEQMKEKHAQLEKEKELELQLERDLVRQRLLEEEKEKQLLEMKREEMRKLKQELQKQISEIREKEQKTEELKRKEERELRLKSELERIALLRNELENGRRRKEFSTFLRHQYQAKLKEKSQRIRTELEEDKKLLQQVEECLKQEQEQNKLRETARRQIDKANVLLREYTEMEKQREKQLDFIFCEEARKMWEKLENRWKAEQEARNNLLRDVLTTVQKQVKDKLESYAENQKRLLEDREEHLKRLEESNMAFKQRENEVQELQKKWMVNVKKQMEERQLMKTRQKEQEVEEYRKQQRDLEQEEIRILEELKKIDLESHKIGRR